MAFSTDMDDICDGNLENLRGWYLPVYRLYSSIDKVKNTSSIHHDNLSSNMHRKDYGAWLNSTLPSNPGFDTPVKILFVQAAHSRVPFSDDFLSANDLCSLLDAIYLPKAGVVALKRLNMTFGTTTEVRSSSTIPTHLGKLSRFYYAEPGWTICWVETETRQHTWAIVICGSETYMPKLFDHLLAECQTRISDLHIPLFLAILIAKMSLAQMTPWLAERTAEVLDVENKTGLLGYAVGETSKTILSTGQYKTISDRISLSQGALIDMSLRYRTLLAFTDFVKRMNKKHCKPSGGWTQDDVERSNQINEMMTIMAEHINIRYIKIESLKQRTQSLTTLISNIIAQRDSSANIMIAKASQEMARESRRDNLSMMTIAMTTMFFLPGTFVASFFAMPLFDWEAASGQTVMTHRFSYYWAVTAPLTALVFVVWAIIFMLKRTRDAKDDRKGMQEVVDAFKTDMPVTMSTLLTHEQTPPGRRAPYQSQPPM